MRLAPSILSFDPLRLGYTVPALETAGAEVLHLDVMDGQYVPPITFGDVLVKAVRPISNMEFEAHLMTLTPDRHFDAFIEAGCHRLIFHVEATDHAYRHAQSLRSRGISPGIALNPGTPVEDVIPLLEVVDLVLVMTVNPGWGGQAFIPSALEKVRRLRALRGDLILEVDGGIDPHTIGTAQSAGVDQCVVGSFLAHAPDLREAVAELRRACE